MKQLAEIGSIYVVIVFVVGSATIQVQIAKNVAQKSPWGSTDEIEAFNMMTDASTCEARDLL